MKLSEIARYWAARELTRIDRGTNAISFQAPFACPQFTIRLSGPFTTIPRLAIGNGSAPLQEVSQPLKLTAGAWTRQAAGIVVCFDLPKGASSLEL